jgi:hypothetical protein
MTASQSIVHAPYMSSCVKAVASLIPCCWIPEELASPKRSPHTATTDEGDVETDASTFS